jgi:hypothetical protein
MKLIIETDKESVKDIHLDSEEAVSFDDLLAILFCVLENLVTNIMKDNDADEELKLSLYEHFAAIFDKFLGRVFPDVAPEPFSLSDAGLLYAQDQIIKRAEKKGISYEEALAQYEEKARKYVEEQRSMLS